MNQTDEGTAPKSSERQVSPLTLEEARRRYDDEERRRTNIESKIATVITVDALIISIVGIFAAVSILEVLSMSFALFSVIIGMWALRPLEYSWPGKPIDDFFQYSGVPESKQREQLLIDYIVAVDGDGDSKTSTNIGNSELNESKYKSFKICILLTFISLLFLLGGKIVPIIYPGLAQFS